MSTFWGAPTAQNSPELHFRFINSFLQPSRVGSLLCTNDPSFWQDYNSRLRTQALGISSVAFTRSISIIAASTKMLLTCQACFVFVLHYCSAMITAAPK